MDTFEVTLVAPDGKVLESASLQVSQLSRKWLDVCDCLLDGGPILSMTFGGTLSHWHIDCAAGLVYLKVHGKVALAGALLESTSTQNDQLLRLFEERTSLRTGGLALDRRPHFLALDTFAAEVSDDESLAVFQFSYHFAAAYFRWGAPNKSLERTREG